MRFINDRQRKACFAHMFSRDNRFSLYFDDFTGDVRSDKFGDVAFNLKSDIPITEAMSFLNKYPEQDFAGIRRVEIPARHVLKKYGKEDEFVTPETALVTGYKGPVPKLTVGYPGTGGVKPEESVAYKLRENVGYQTDEDTIFDDDYLNEVYKSDIFDKPIKGVRSIGDVESYEDEVAFERTLQRLTHPSYMEDRAWRMGKQPKIGIRTVKDYPKRKDEKRAEELLGEPIEEYEPQIMDIADIVVRESKPDVKKSVYDVGVDYKVLSDLILTNKFEIISHLSDEEREGLLDYANRYWSPKMELIRRRIIEAKR